MSAVIIGLIGVILFIGMAVVGASYFGSYLSKTEIDAAATDYMSQGSQISRAIKSYSQDNGKLPIEGLDPANTPIDVLMRQNYMKSKPPGGSSPWVLDTKASALITPVKGPVDQAMKICIVARQKVGVNDPSNPKKCDGSTGTLELNDPCCIM